jgi:long-chain acyl-CoA synthetase
MFDAAIANEDKRKMLAAQGKSSGFADFKHNIFDKLVFQKVRARFGGKLKYAFSGGAAISKEVAEFIDNLGITVYEGYGLTETSPIATANWPGARKIGSVGKAIPGVRIVIGHIASGDDKNGEIVVHGHNVMQGYHNMPEEDAKAFTADHGFRTGDMGFLDEEGFLYITGRIKEQYKLENGKYVSPAPLEEHLKLSPFITNVMVYGDNKPYNVALVIADMPVLEAWAAEHHLTTKGDALLAEAAVKKLFDEQVEKFSAEFKQFEKIRKLALVAEDFTTQNDMLTPSLKVKRRVVLKKYGEQLTALYDA